MSTATSLYDIPLQRIDGTPTTLGAFKGKALLIVNVASKCGLTPQYEGLEALYKRHKDQGLEVLGFPCNDFAGQEPGTEAEITSFCTLNYGVTFPMFAKVNCNSAPRHPLYAALIEAQPVATPSGDPKLHDILSTKGLLPPKAEDIKWNFEKFLVSRDGAVIGRFAPDVKPDASVLASALQQALG